MVVEHELVCSTSVGYPVYHLHTLLVTTVEEVYFETFDAHLGVFLACFVELVVENIEDCPEDDADTFLLAVADESRKVELGNDG